MSGTNKRKNFNSIVVLLLATGIIVLANLFIQKHFSRLDLTEEKQYTLSEASRNSVRKLNDTITVTVYVSKGLPAYMMPMKQGVVDLLEEYQSYSKNRMRVKFIDPGDDDETKRELAALGIQQATWRVIEKDKIEAVNGYFGILLRYKDRLESLPVVGRLDTFEYSMTATILKVSATEVKTIGFLKGHEEYDPFIEMGAVGDYIQNQYRLNVVSLEYSPYVPADVNVLVIARPVGDLPDWELFAIDQFLMGGGSLVVLRDQVRMKQNQLWADPVTTNLDELLAHYGVSFGNELVLDRYNQSASFNMGRGMFMTTPYPFWVKVIRANMDEQNPALTNINEVLMPWATWLEIEEREDVEVSKILMSSEFSWTQPHTNLNPQQQFAPMPENMRSRVLAARLSGKFTSYFKGRDIPRKPQEQEEGMPPAPEFPEADRLDESAGDSAVFVAGNARFVTGETLRMAGTNLHFLINSIDQMAFGTDLISLRARGIKPRGLEGEIDETKKSKIRMLNLFGMPFAVLLFVVVRGLYRRSRRTRV